MKKFFIDVVWTLGFAAGIIALSSLLSVKPARATDFPVASRNNTVNATLLSAATLTTNKTGSAIFVEGNYLHTFQGIGTGTNAVNFAIDRSLDGANWVIVSTNALAASTGVADTAFTGKYSYVRARALATNSAVTVLYLGGN